MFSWKLAWGLLACHSSPDTFQKTLKKKANLGKRNRLPVWPTPCQNHSPPLLYSLLLRPTLNCTNVFPALVTSLLNHSIPFHGILSYEFHTAFISAWLSAWFSFTATTIVWIHTALNLTVTDSLRANNLKGPIIWEQYNNSGITKLRFIFKFYSQHLA